MTTLLFVVRRHLYFFLTDRLFLSSSCLADDIICFIVIRLDVRCDIKCYYLRGCRYCRLRGSSGFPAGTGVNVVVFCVSFIMLLGMSSSCPGRHHWGRNWLLYDQSDGLETSLGFAVRQ